MPANMAPLPTGADVAAFLGQGEDTGLVALAGAHVLIVSAMARSYTRDNGFVGGAVAEDIAAVITTATARMVGNPEQLRREQIGDYNVAPTPFAGWSLVETFVLNRYRRRAQ